MPSLEKQIYNTNRLLRRWEREFEHNRPCAHRAKHIIIQLNKKLHRLENIRHIKKV